MTSSPVPERHIRRNPFLFNIYFSNSRPSAAESGPLGGILDPVGKSKKNHLFMLPKERDAVRLTEQTETFFTFEGECAAFQYPLLPLVN